METVEAQRRVVEQRRQADFEAYHHWEYERRLYDEITDIAERVRAPVIATQEFGLTVDGLVSERGELLRPVIEDGLADARRMALTNPDWRVEVRRREIELEELNDYETLAVNRFGAIVSYWLIPDAVRTAKSDLPGYKRDRLTMFTRIAVATDTGVKVKYHSYDGSYLPGVQAMDRVLGYDDFDPMQGSEEIAAKRRYPVPPRSIDELDEQLRQAYDGVMSRDKKHELYSGREPLAIKDVMGFISSQQTLLGEHMGVLAKIFAEVRDPHERNKKMEPHRYNLAAAIDGSLHGKVVTSVQEAGDGARSEGLNFDRDCPTGDTDDTAAAQLGDIGFAAARHEQKTTIWGHGECVACLRDKAIAINKCNMCQGCEDVHNTLGDTGLDVLMTEAKRRRTAEKAKKQRIGAIVLKETIAPPASRAYTKRQDDYILL